MHAARRPDLLLVTVIWACTACGPLLKRAPFAERPTTIRPGFPLGPFDGRVEDAATGKPIADALVQATWHFERGIGNATSYATRAHVGTTDADGHYRVPRLRSLPGGLSTRLARFTLLIYRQGYVAYRSDSHFPSNRPRIDFTQYDNTVQLKRWQPQLSHADHLLFSGGNHSFREAMRWERRDAARELDRLSGAPEEPPIVNPHDNVRAVEEAEETPDHDLGQAGSWLSADDVRRITGFSGHFDLQSLRDAGDATSSVHLRAIDRPESFDVALRLWSLDSPAALRSKFEALREALPTPQPTDAVGDRAFTSEQGDIRGICFIVRKGNAIGLLTCGNSQCTSRDQVLDLARVIEQHAADQAAETLPPEELMPLEDVSP